MRRRVARWVLATIAGLALGLGTAAAQSPPPIYTKNAALRLPIQLDERSRTEVSQLKLYVHGPGGKWECVQTAPSNQTTFDYRAPMDGEYLFTFVTIDKRGNANPGNVDTAPPHRSVVVDTTPPDVTVQPIPMRGERALQCQVRDANPDYASLHVWYLAPDNTWQALTVAAADTPTVFRVPNPAVFESKLRVMVADRAGNKTTREIDLGDPTAPAGMPKPAVDKGKPDPALMTRDDLVVPPMPDKNVRAVGHNDLPKGPRTDLPDVPALPDYKMPENALDIKIPDVPGTKTPDVRPPVKTPDDLKLPDLPGDPGAIKPPPVDVPPLPPTKNTTSAMKPSTPDLPSPPKAMPGPATKPPGNHPILNTRTCTVNYQLDGPTRYPNKIDFWASADGGRTWNQVRDLNGGIPPAKLSLPGDGVFSIRIRPGGGTKPPEAMEDPDCVVEVDTTKPIVNLMTPALGDEGVMTIGWTAADENLLSNSISLYYAPKPAGPWEVIVTGYKNTGEYKWAVPAGLAGPVYLRVEATDRAGNIGRYESPTPVALEVGKQRVKVIGVGPAQ
ncbi:MAG TPA: hypothetical protein VHR66_20490 [Gemmataceae bacterium]|jgi:hypothetical protein|nr:hypothetical protein [Gemmataceae bacterium]